MYSMEVCVSTVSIIVGDDALGVPLEVTRFKLSRICAEQHCADNTNEVAVETSRGAGRRGRRSLHFGAQVLLPQNRCRSLRIYVALRDRKAVQI